MIIFPSSPVWNVIWEFAKTPTCKYSAKSSEIWIQSSELFRPKLVLVLASEMSQKFFYSENGTMTYLEQQNPRIQSSDTKCYEASSQKDRKQR